MRKGILLALVAGIISAFTISENDPFVTKTMRNFLIRMKFRVQEKLYLHTDRAHYNAGEKVWFRAYLVDAATHHPSEASNFVYVELTDRQDSVYQRVKIVARDSLFFGYLELSDKLPQGEYFIRAYTYWMQNWGEDYLFKKKIRILNPQDTKVITQIERREEGGQGVVDIRFTNSRKEPYQKVWIQYQVNGKDKKGKTQQKRTDESGKISVKQEAFEKYGNILVAFGEQGPFPFSRRLYVPELVKDFQVFFCPEGGDLLSGNLQNIAFKALGSDGFGVDIEGAVYDDQNQLVCDLKSVHKGMGNFSIYSVPGRQYHAVVRTADSLEKNVPLPQVNRSGIGLKVARTDSVLAYTVLLADSARLPDSLYLLAHARGVVFGVLPVRSVITGKLPKRILPEGIMHFVLMDARCRVYSQRLSFVWDNDRPEPEIFPDRSFYAARDSVNLVLGMKSPGNRKLQGAFSIAVTDDNIAEPDSLAGDILSDLLLTSDLKGYIEEPAYYFRNMNRRSEYLLDLVMLTHGWTRFDVAKAAKGEYDPVPWYMEKGQAISGKVDNFWGKDAGLAKLIAFSSSGMFRMTNADSSGYFFIDGILFSDGTKFVVQGQSKKGRRNVEVKIDEEEFLKPENKFPYSPYTQAEDDNFYNQYQKDYYYEDGMKVYVLDEVVIRRQMAKKTYSFYDQMADYNLDSAKIASMRDRDIRWILSELPGVMVEGDKITLFSKPLYVLLNNFEEQTDRVLLIPTRDLLSVSLIRSPNSQMLFGDKAAEGALVITAEPNFYPPKERLNMAVFSPFGYQKHAEFYVPPYHIDSVRLALRDTVDNRTTLYWNPRVRTDAGGRAKVSFFTADGSGDYTVTLEGLLNDGTICRKRQKIKVKSGE